MKKTLSEISEELNQQSAFAHLPAMIFITDQQAQPYPEKVIEKLPENSMVILRDYDHDNRAELGEALRYICTQRKIKFLVAKDLTLALQLGADGIHLPEFMIGETIGLRMDHPNLFFSVSCHSEEAVVKALMSGAEIILLAPIFPTHSHSETFDNKKNIVGVNELKKLCTRYDVPIYALGGVNKDTAINLKDTGVAGVAGIRGF